MYRFPTFPNLKQIETSYVVPNLVCNRFDGGYNYSDYYGGRAGDNIGITQNANGDVWIAFGADGISTLEDANAWLADNPLQVVYELAAPTTYTLTADQVTTLLGDNTVWMDADGSIDLTYRADTEKYVERRIAEVQALILENNG
jgi:hypothetical protein